MSRQSISVAPPEWVNGAEAKAVIGCGHAALLRLVVLGQLRALNEPGQCPRYHKEDCERIAKSRRAVSADNLQLAGA